MKLDKYLEMDIKRFLDEKKGSVDTSVSVREDEFAILDFKKDYEKEARKALDNNDFSKLKNIFLELLNIYKSAPTGSSKKRIAKNILKNITTMVNDHFEKKEKELNFIDVIQELKTIGLAENLEALEKRLISNQLFLPAVQSRTKPVLNMGYGEREYTQQRFKESSFETLLGKSGEKKVKEVINEEKSEREEMDREEGKKEKKVSINFDERIEEILLKIRQEEFEKAEDMILSLEKELRENRIEEDRYILALKNAKEKLRDAKEKKRLREVYSKERVNKRKRLYPTKISSTEEHVEEISKKETQPTRFKVSKKKEKEKDKKVKGKDNKALVIFVKDHEKDIDLLYEKSLEYIKKKDYSSAKQLLKHILKIDPMNVRAKIRLLELST